MSTPRPAPPPGLSPAARRLSLSVGGARSSETAAEARGRKGPAEPPAPMVPTAFWAALAVGLQLWAAGRAVPAQVGDSRGPVWGGGRRPIHPRAGARPPPRGVRGAVTGVRGSGRRRHRTRHTGSDARRWRPSGDPGFGTRAPGAGTLATATRSRTSVPPPSVAGQWALGRSQPDCGPQLPLPL